MDGGEGMAARPDEEAGITAGPWQRAQEIFLAALDQPPDRRSAYASDICGKNDALRLQVEHLLTGHEASDGLLESVASEPEQELPLPSFAGPYCLLEEIGH